MTDEHYVSRVAFELRDLPWRTRRELLSDLRAHLSELPAGTDLAARLGPPEEYAADLRSAAGLERRRGVVAFLRARRPRNLILTVVVLTLIGLAIGAVAWIDSYQPLGPGNAMQFPLTSKPSAGQAGETVVFRDGRPFLLGITIHNAGRFSVHVLGVPKSVTDFYVGHLLMSKDQTGRQNERPLELFHPFDMKPGSFRWLVFKGVFACTTGMGGGEPGRGYGAISREAVPVRFSFLWRTATAWIHLDDPLMITFPNGCPSPSR